MSDNPYDGREDVRATPYDGPIEELRAKIDGRRVVLDMIVTGVEFHGPCALVRGRLPSGAPGAFFVHALLLMAIV